MARVHFEKFDFAADVIHQVQREIDSRQVLAGNALFRKFAMTDDLKYVPMNDCYEYLGGDDSLLYASVKDSADPKDQVIKKLLEDKANMSRAAHRASTY